MRTLTNTRMLTRTLPAAAIIGAGVLLAGSLQASPQGGDGTAKHEPRAMMGGGMGMMGGGSMMGSEGGSMMGGMMEMMSGMMGMMQQMGATMGHCQQMMDASGHAPTPPAQPGGPKG